MLANLYKRYFGILAKDKILFFGSGKVAYPSAAKLFENYSNLHYVTHYTRKNKSLKKYSGGFIDPPPTIQPEFSVKNPKYFFDRIKFSRNSPSQAVKLSSIIIEFSRNFLSSEIVKFKKHKK